MPKTARLPLGAHQERALDTIAAEEGELIEYGTGTGKTRILAEAVKMFVDGGEMPVAIAVPNSLIEQTYEQFEEWVGRRWSEKNIAVLDSSLPIYRRRERLKRGTEAVYIFSHESMSYPMIREALNSRAWAATMIDEASRFRNSSKRTTTLKGLGRHSNTRYALTGNLTVRSPADCWHITNFLRPGVWGTNDRDTFHTKYFTLGGFTGREPTGLRPDTRKEFFAILDSMRIQCELRDLRDLPPRELTIRRTDMGKDQAAAYEQMRRKLKVEIELTSDSVFMSQAKTYATRLLRLQEIAAGFTRNVAGDVVFFHSPKTHEMVESLLDDPGTPTIIWYWFRPEAQIIRAALAKHGLPHVWFGDKGAVQKFMAGKVNHIVIQMAKGGYGLNLTRADRMEFHTLPWDLDLYSQATDRNVRFNTAMQKTVNGITIDRVLSVTHNIVRGSCEEHVRLRLVDKAGMSRQFSRSQALEMLK